MNPEYYFVQNMKFVIAIVLVVAALSEAGREVYNPEIESRIIAGAEAKVGEIPWQVAIQSKKGLKSEFCGGALIDEEWVLTSAYCISKGDKYELQFGGLKTGSIEIGRVSMTSKVAKIHPNYVEWNRNFDVALVKLPKAIKITERVDIVKLPRKLQIIGNAAKATVSGWGSVKDNGAKSRTLRFVELKSIFNFVCHDDFGKQEVIGSSVCFKAVEEDIASPCDGDNGGPLFTTDKNGVSTLVGIFSFNHKLGCEAGKPAVFVRTESILDWIKAETAA